MYDRAGLMSVEGFLPRTAQPFKGCRGLCGATKSHPRTSRLPECSSLMLTLWAPSYLNVFSLPEGSSVFCLNWTCLASEQEETGTGMCGCALLTPATDLTIGSHGCGSWERCAWGGAWCWVFVSSWAQSRNSWKSVCSLCSLRSCV